jgi:hypothetical protein
LLGFSSSVSLFPHSDAGNQPLALPHYEFHDQMDADSVAVRWRPAFAPALDFQRTHRLRLIGCRLRLLKEQKNIKCDHRVLLCFIVYYRPDSARRPLQEGGPLRCDDRGL